MRFRFLFAVGVASVFPFLAAAPLARAQATSQTAIPTDSTAPTLITLQTANVLPEDAFDQIGKQAGVKFFAEPNTLFDGPEFQKPVSFDINQKPFWQAMRDVCDAVGVYPQPSYVSNSRRVGLAKGNAAWAKRPSAIAGQFMILVDRVYRNKSIDLANQGNGISDQLSVQMTIFAEPKLRIGQVSGVLELQDARDDRGNSLLPTPRQQVFSSFGSAPRSWTWTVSASLSPPANAGTKIAVLKGTAQAVLYNKTENWEVDDILNAKNIAKDFGDNHYLLQQVTATDKGYDVELKMTNSAPAGAPQTPFALLQYARLLDGKGKAYNVGGWGGNGMGNGTTVKLNFVRDTLGTEQGAPEKFILEVPVETQTIAIPISFTDLPLP